MLNQEPTLVSAGPFIIVLPCLPMDSHQRTAPYHLTNPRPLPSRDRQGAVAAHCVHNTPAITPSGIGPRAPRHIISKGLA
jgi:hypothetical protein